MQDIEDKFYDIVGDDEYQINPITFEVRHKKTHKILKQRKLGKYIVVDKTRWFWLHRSIARTFCDGYKEGLVVDHIDGNSLNNKPENLRWCTHKENCNNPITKLKAKIGQDKYYSTHHGPNLGRKWSDETKNRISQSQKIRLQDPEKRKFLSTMNKELMKDPERRKQKSEQMKKYYSDENNKQYVRERTKEAMQVALHKDPTLKQRLSSGGKYAGSLLWINNGIQSKRVQKDNINQYIQNGWKRGRLYKKK